MSQFDFGRVASKDQPRNNIELMLDVETFGIAMGAPVITIGATLFDPYSSDHSSELLRRSLLIRVDIAEAVKFANHVSGETLRWWFEQDDRAIKALVGDDCIGMQEALRKLHRYCHDRGRYVNDEFFPGLTEFPKVCRFWAKDPDFDMRLLEHYYEHPALDAKMPWKFFENRSVRTIQDLAWPDPSERPSFEVDGVAHDARWDSVVQAMMIQAGIRRLGLAKDQDVDFAKWEGNQ